MKGDFTRLSYKHDKHYTKVLRQQGRVDLDVDWNEQVLIQDHMDRLKIKDIIGRCGCPDAGRSDKNTDKKCPDNDGFCITYTKTDKGPSFSIAPGRIYVDGILCEIEPDKSSKDGSIDYKNQPDYINPPDLDITAARNDLVYLDVWQRHMTVLEDEEIREVALGGPDTTTRAKTICQVKVLKNFEGESCEAESPQWDELIRPSDAKLSIGVAIGEKASSSTTYPCQQELSGEYSGLENRLYRIEIHDCGEPYVLPRPENPKFTVITNISGSNKVAVGSGGEWRVGQLIEIFSDSTDKNGQHILARISAIDNGVLTLDRDIPDLTGLNNLKIRKAATFKWSRDNGSVAFSIEGLTPAGSNTIKVKSLGRDQVLTIHEGDWVELTDDITELSGAPGMMAEVKDIDLAQMILKLSKDVSGIDTGNHAKVRRWDQGKDAIEITSGQIALEDGLWIKLEGSSFRTGDYWTYAVRTDDRNLAGIDKSPIPPQGVEHSYCKLAIIEWAIDQGAGGFAGSVHDCRRHFKPLISPSLCLLYAGGDGQEAMPGSMLPLPQPLRAGVLDGSRPVQGASVLFELEDRGESGGKIKFDGKTNSDGIAECYWTLGLKDKDPGRVKATLRDSKGLQIGMPIFFNANLSAAKDVFYDPEGCPRLQKKGITNVQNAIKELCQPESRLSIFYVEGDGQEAGPKSELPKTLKVGVFDGTAPAPGRAVKFELEDPGDSIEDIKPKDATTNPHGIAECHWTLCDKDRKPGRVKATLLDSDGKQVGLPVFFSANLIIPSIAKEVIYEPGDCDLLIGSNDVQDALERLCDAFAENDETFFITGIDVSDSENKRQPLLLYDKVPFDTIARGIDIICSEDVDSASVEGNPVVFVTMYPPYPPSVIEGGTLSLFHQPIVIFGDIEVVNKRIIRWIPFDIHDEKVRAKLLQLMKKMPEGGMRARLEIKGNLILSEGDKPSYLDCDAFLDPKKPGQPDQARKIKYHTGDGRPGGNFEMWFWVLPKIVPLPA